MGRLPMTRIALILSAAAALLGLTLGATFASPSTPLVDRRERGSPQVPAGRRRHDVRRVEHDRADRERRLGPVGSGSAGGDPGRGAPGGRDRGREGEGSEGRPRSLSGQGTRGRRQRPRRFRRFLRACGEGVPGCRRVHRRQRAEPAALLAAAVQSRREPGLGGCLPDRARGLLRRDPRGRQARDRRRPLAARERQPAGAVECLHLASPLHPRARRCVPRERATTADHGRVQLPPVPQREQRHAVRRLRVAECRHAELRPDQAGAVGRLQRHEAAARRDRPADLAGRGGLAGPDRAD